MAIVPYNTDAPLYHYPIATIGLIAVNTLMYASALHADPQALVPLALQFGDGLHPVQWVTNNFLHVSLWHLLGNMFYLWVFGLVVEGKLGWWRFLAFYLAIATIYSAIVQAAMLGSHGNVVGTSGVIFGIMAVALIWAPKNDINCVVWFLFYIWKVEVPIMGLSITYLLWEGFIVWMHHFSISSELLHLVGAAVGAVFGVAFLKLGWVDCEGWDLFAVWRGTPGAESSLPSRPMTIEKPPTMVLHRGEQTQFLALQDRVRSGDAAGAAQLYQQQRKSRPNWLPPATDLMALIQAMHQQQCWSESIPLMIDYLRHFPDDGARLRLRLAQLLIDVEHCPAKALRVLSKVSPAELPPERQAIHQQLASRAEQLKLTSGFEMVDDDV